MAHYLLNALLYPRAFYARVSAYCRTPAPSINYAGRLFAMTRKAKRSNARTCAEKNRTRRETTIVTWTAVARRKSPSRRDLRPTVFPNFRASFYQQETKMAGAGYYKGRRGRR